MFLGLTLPLKYDRLGEYLSEGEVLQYMTLNKRIILLFSVILAGLMGIFPFCLPILEKAKANVSAEEIGEEVQALQIVEETTLLPLASPPSLKVSRKINVVVTGYSSCVEETDENPFVTASGSGVKDGIVANNLLPFGTTVRLPEVFGEKTFIVEDRMNRRKGYYHVDIWFPSKELALNFGAKITEMEVVN